MHMKIVVDRDGRFILGQFSQPFHSIPQMVYYYTVAKLPIKGAEHMSLLYPVAYSLLWVASAAVPSSTAGCLLSAECFALPSGVIVLNHSRRDPAAVSVALFGGGGHVVVGARMSHVWAYLWYNCEVLVKVRSYFVFLLQSQAFEYVCSLGIFRNGPVFCLCNFCFIDLHHILLSTKQRQNLQSQLPSTVD